MLSPLQSDLCSHHSIQTALIKVTNYLHIIKSQWSSLSAHPIWPISICHNSSGNNLQLACQTPWDSSTSLLTPSWPPLLVPPLLPILLSWSIPVCFGSSTSLLTHIFAATNPAIFTSCTSFLAVSRYFAKLLAYSYTSYLFPLCNKQQPRWRPGKAQHIVCYRPYPKAHMVSLRVPVLWAGFACILTFT